MKLYKQPVFGTLNSDSFQFNVVLHKKDRIVFIVLATITLITLRTGGQFLAQFGDDAVTTTGDGNPCSDQPDGTECSNYEYCTIGACYLGECEAYDPICGECPGAQICEKDGNGTCVCQGGDVQPTQCGDGVKEGDEECELSTDCPVGQECSEECGCVDPLPPPASASSIAPDNPCGNGIRDGGEQCDGGAWCCGTGDDTCIEDECTCPANLVPDGDKGCKCPDYFWPNSPNASADDVYCEECRDGNDGDCSYIDTDACTDNHCVTSIQDGGKNTCEVRSPCPADNPHCIADGSNQGFSCNECANNNEEYCGMSPDETRVCCEIDSCILEHDENCVEQCIQKRGERNVACASKSNPEEYKKCLDESSEKYGQCLDECEVPGTARCSGYSPGELGGGDSSNSAASSRRNGGSGGGSDGGGPGYVGIPCSGLVGCWKDMCEGIIFPCGTNKCTQNICNIDGSCDHRPWIMPVSGCSESGSGGQQGGSEGGSEGGTESGAEGGQQGGEEGGQQGGAEGGEEVGNKDSSSAQSQLLVQQSSQANAQSTASLSSVDSSDNNNGNTSSAGGGEGGGGVSSQLLVQQASSSIGLDQPPPPPSVFSSVPLDAGQSSSAAVGGDEQSSVAPGEFCGNQILEDPEECDFGDANLPPGTPGGRCSCMPGADCKPPKDGAMWIGCRWPKCGDGIINNNLIFLAGPSTNFDLIVEKCDDGNTEDGDGCSSTCAVETPSTNKSSATILANVASSTTSSIAPSAVASSAPLLVVYQSSALSITLITNTTSSTPTIGNTSTSTGTSDGEDDDGDGVDDDGVRHNNNNNNASKNTTRVASERENLVASAPICGNGTLDDSEECDDRNRRDNDGCSSVCLLEIGICGDGIVQKLLGEQCESATHSSALPYLCRGCLFMSLTCGDGVIDPGEECDDGALNSTSPDAHCRPNCHVSRCGDGVIDSTEICDDGNALATDGCDRFCRVEESDDTGVTTIASDQHQIDYMATETARVTSQYPPSYQQVNYPQYPTYQQLPYQLPLAQLQPLIRQQGPVGETGPAAVAVAVSGMAAGVSWMRKKKRKR